MEYYILQICYLVAVLTFVLGLKMLSHPESARRGNLVAAAGMFIAIIATIFLHESVHGNYYWIVGGLVLGSIIGTTMALKVQMTAMPQMVSFFNGMGGGCVAVISLTEFMQCPMPGSGVCDPGPMMNSTVGIILAGILVGCVALSGSIIAYGKLEGKIGDVTIPGQTIINSVLLIGLIGLCVYIMTLSAASMPLALTVFGLALLYGVFFVMPIGGADMPVVISLLNSFTGVAAALAGFLYANMVMIAGGILVGAAGSILTILMCNAMNRSLANVLLGAFGGGAAAAESDEAEGTVKETTATDVGVMLSYSGSVMIVPGYGLAVAQAQHLCRELDKQLSDKGVEVNYAIHPVAGRMPGHMNVLLAEADVPYPKLLELEDANEKMKNTDVVVVVGANDVVNPAAEDDPASPIYGMPILHVLEAENVIVIKRSMNPGYAGIQNKLFFHDKNKMLFGDAKDVLQDLVDEVKAN